MTFNSLHPRGAGGRFTAAHHSEPDLSLRTDRSVAVIGSHGECVDVVPGLRDDAPESDWDAWEAGLEIPTFRRGKKFTEYTNRGTPVRITAGVIDREARQVFTRGQCMALAVVLAEANVGTPVIAYTPGTDSLAHALVRLPGGALLDIDGVHDPAELSKGYDLVDQDRDDFADQVDNAEGFARWSDPPNYVMARTFVGAVAAHARTAVTGISTHISR